MPTCLTIYLVMLINYGNCTGEFGRWDERTFCITDIIYIFELATKEPLTFKLCILGA